VIVPVRPGIGALWSVGSCSSGIPWDKKMTQPRWLVYLTEGPEKDQ
jgi:hypothetical protein